MSLTMDDIEAYVTKICLSYPETHEDNPWGERAFKVKGKVFLFLSKHIGPQMLTVKLPISAKATLMHPFAKPTGYGLGKSNWVTCTFDDASQVPLDLVDQWLDESYRAVAPKKVLALLDTPAGEEPKAKQATPKKKLTAKKKEPAKKAAVKSKKKST